MISTLLQINFAIKADLDISEVSLFAEGLQDYFESLTYNHSQEGWQFCCFSQRDISALQCRQILDDVVGKGYHDGVAITALDAQTNWLAQCYQPVSPLEVEPFIIVDPDYISDFKTSNGQIPLFIRADIAFGSGGHGTTYGCLAALDILSDTKFNNILDLGTGSGILAIAAHKTWPQAHILATDCEAESITRTQDHIIKNQCHNIQAVHVTGFENNVIVASAPYDLIIANILAAPLKEMAGDIVDAAAPGAIILLSGMLDEQVDAVFACYADQVILSQAIQKDGWSSLILQKNKQ